MLLGITLESNTYRLAVIIYFLCHIGISAVQSTNLVRKFPVHNNQTAQGSSLKCSDEEYINIVEVYGYKTSFFDVDQIDVAMIHNACFCQQTCDIPYLVTSPYSYWDLYVRFKCLGTCAGTTTGTEISTTLTTSTAETSSSSTPTTVTSKNISVTSTAATIAPALSSTENSSITSEYSYSTGYTKSASERNERRKENIDDNGNDHDKVVPIAVSTCLFIAGVACCIFGCAVYRRSRHTKHSNEDTTERKEFGGYSSLHEHSETAEAGISDHTQSNPRVPATAKEDEGYESIEFVERLQGHENDNKESHECEDVLSPPLVGLAPSHIHGTKLDRQNRIGETAGSNKAEHINMYDDVYDENNSTGCTEAHSLADPYYLHAVARNSDIYNISRATTNEVNDQTAQFMSESSIAATPVCITQNDKDDLCYLSDGGNVQTVPKTIEVDSCIQATACDRADTGYVIPVTRP